MKSSSMTLNEQTLERFVSRGFRYEGDSFYYFDPSIDAEIEVPLSSILIVAEQSTNDGPWSDDVFLLVVDRDKSGFYRFPLETATTTSLIRWLDCRLGPNLEWRLYNATDARNNIVWPHHLSGTPLMVEHEAIPANFKQLVLGFFGLWKDQYCWEYSDQVKQYLREMGKVDDEL